MNIQALRYIIAVEHSRSINKAAQHLYVSQSSISWAIKEVEDQIGITLFHRTNKGVIPTYDGEKFIDQARHLLQEMEHLEGQYFRSPRTARNTLLVATQRCTPVIHAFIAYYRQFCAQQDLMNLAIQEDTTDGIIQQIAGGIYGVGILHYTSDQEDSFFSRCEAMGLEYHVLDRSPVCAQVRPGHPLSHFPSITVDMLAPYPHVTYSDEDITCINYCSDISQYNPGILKKRILLQDRGTLLQIINSTDSYYVGCDFSWLYSDGVMGISPPCYVPLRDVDFTLNTLWAQRAGRELTEPEQRFIQLLAGIFSARDRQ